MMLLEICFVLWIAYMTGGVGSRIFDLWIWKHNEKNKMQRQLIPQPLLTQAQTQKQQLIDNEAQLHYDWQQMRRGD